MNLSSLFAPAGNTRPRHPAVEALESRTLLSGVATLTATVGAVPAAGLAGGKLDASIDVTLANSGPDAYKGKTTVELLASTAGVFTAGEPLLGKLNRNLKIAVGGSATAVVKVGSLPKTLAAGNYYVVADVIEPTASVQGVSATTIDVSPPFIDLSDAFDPNDPPVVQYTSSLELEGLTAPIEVSNLGNVRAVGTLETVIEISTSSTGSNPQIIATVKKHISIEPGKTLTLKLTKLGRGFELPTGQAYFVAVVDPNNVFHDTNLMNNTAVSTTFFFSTP